MKNLLFFPLLLLSIAGTALPNGWVLTVSNQSYANLSNPIIAPLSQGWDDPDIKIPLNFTHTHTHTHTHTAFGANSDTMYTGFSHGGVLSPNSTIIYNMYTFGIDVIDRATDISNLPSSISYQTVGVVGDRITKIQWKDFGFKGEYLTDFVLKDSGNVQVWFYEDDNSFEYRFGPAMVSDFQRNLQSTKLQMGIITPVSSMNWLFYVKSLAPAILDSTSISTTTVQNGITSYPVDGTVIHFGPVIPIGTNDAIKLNSELTFYPSLVTNSINLDFANNINGAATVRILGMNGQLMLQQKISNQKNKLEVGQLAASNYILQVQYNGQIVYYQFTKQ